MLLVRAPLKVFEPSPFSTHPTHPYLFGLRPCITKDESVITSRSHDVKMTFEVLELFCSKRLQSEEHSIVVSAY